MTKGTNSAQISRDQKQQMRAEQEQIRQRTRLIRHQVVVLSGKGGVGKSTVAVNLATSLALAGKKVGLLDIDIHGPSIPKTLNLEGKALQVVGDAIVPVRMNENLKVMSIGFMLRDDDDAVIWRGPRKYHMIKQFLKDVDWGSLDFLVIDCPPGTGDEPLSIIQLLECADGALIVTTPQEVALADVRKSISFCRNLNLPILGVVENMSGFVCPNCAERIDIFKSGGGEQMARQMHVRFLGRIPIDPQVVDACDSGKPFIHYHKQTAASTAFEKIAEALLQIDDDVPKSTEARSLSKGDKKMRIAIPIIEGKLSQHFGHCDTFAIIDADGDSGQVLDRKDLTPPRHEPGALPKWLHEEGVNVIIAGGMGQRAQQLFEQNQIEVVVGAPAESPENLVSAYLSNTLQAGENICDH